MEFKKQVKRFVAGSNKSFRIFECTVDEVERFVASNGRDMVKVTVSNGEEYQGLFNQFVYDFLCENEGTPSFVVLWDAPKGKPMLAYVKQIWEDHINGVDREDATQEENKDSFVYMWINSKTDIKYIGKHTGTVDDGYVASSETFLSDYNTTPEHFTRTILAYGSSEDMHTLETMLLLQLKTRMSDMYYNLSDNIKGNSYE